MTLSRRARIALLAAIFLAAFFLRAYQPLSRPSQWLRRARIFNNALDKHNWEAMYQSSHPGFTVMAISGLSLRLHKAVDGTPAEVVFAWAIPPEATEAGVSVAVGTFGLALVLSGLLMAIVLALRRLGDWPLALAAGGLLVFAPFYLAHSRALHVDALLSTLMLLSALLLLAALQTSRRRYLLASGLVAGFCLLTKSPGLFLVPFTGLALLVHLLARLAAGWKDHPQGRARWVLRETWAGMILPGLLWAAMIPLPFLLWPAMWVKPLVTLQDMFIGTQKHVIKTHVNPRFFAGQIYNRDRLSTFFYPVSIAFHESFLTLPLVLAALGHYALWPKRARRPLPSLTFWLLVAYVVFFVIQMTLGAKQADRYVLPAHLALAVLAAVGLLGVIDLIGGAVAARGKRPLHALPAVLIGLAVGLQALVMLPFAPDYGAHRNYLLGGGSVAVHVVELMGQNEGSTYIADYLNSQPDPESLRVGVIDPVHKTLEQYFPGEILVGMPDDPAPDYYLFSMAIMQRDFRRPQWKSAWRRLQDQPPLVKVVLGGAEYMRLYAAQPDPATETITIRRGWTGFVGVAWAWTLVLVGAVVWALRPPPLTRPSDLRRPPLAGWEWALVLLILLGGFVLRAGRLLDAPPGIIHDEVRGWLDARLVLGGDIRALYPNGGQEALYPFVQAVSFRLLGDNLLGARLPAMAFGMLGIALGFSLMQRLFGRGAAMIAAAGMATSFWALMFSRLAVRGISLPVMALLTTTLFVRILHGERPSVWSYLLAGLALGLTFYTTPAALAFAVVLVVWLGALALVRGEWLRGKWAGLGLSLLLAAAMVVPLVRAWSDPANAALAAEGKAPLEALRDGNLGPAVANLKAVLGVFSVKGDVGPEFNIPGWPLLPTVPVALGFYAGVVVALWALFDPYEARRPGYLLALLWLVCLVAPALMADRPVIPSRLTGLMGVIYVFPAIAADAALRLARRVGKPRVGAALVVLVVFGVAAQLANTAGGYFVTWVGDPAVRFLYQDGYRALAADLDAGGVSPPVAVGGLTPYIMDPASMRLLMADDGRADALGFFDVRSALLVPPPSAPGGAVSVVVPGSLTLHPALDAHLDVWGFRLDSRGAASPYDVYTLPGGQEGLRQPLDALPVAFHAPDDVSAGPVITLLGLERVGEASPGSDFYLLTYWQAARSYPVLLRIFVHLTDESGNILTQSDVLGVPSPAWRDGDLIVQAHDLALPPDAPPGPYRLTIGLYDPLGGARLVTPGLTSGDYTVQPLP